MEANPRFYSLSQFYKEHFGCKVFKLSLDGGFSCPNLDGTVGTTGCLFCSDQGAGEFSGNPADSIEIQVKGQLERLQKKWPQGKYIAYFQNFTNTYKPLEALTQLYAEALTQENVVGLSIATRPDCLSEGVLNLLSKLNKETFLTIELGLQTKHDKTAQLIHRGYLLSTFETALQELHQRKIRTVVHLLFGLPGETKNEMIETARYVGNLGVFGVKLHSLYLSQSTSLGQLYLKQQQGLLSGAYENFPSIQPLERQSYISLLSEVLKWLPPNCTIHRLTGDAPWKGLIAPKWSTDKLGMHNDIQNYLRKTDTYQGAYFNRPSL